MKAKTSKFFTGAAALVLIVLAYSLGYYRGYWARGPVVHFERDTADVVAHTPAKEVYEPYFNKVNELPKLTR
jgi:ABC-type cobalt transport system substrate-binding protein